MKRIVLLFGVIMMAMMVWADDGPKNISLSNDQKKLVMSNNDFAFNLFRTARNEESQILSPLSITYALGMLNNGAAGETLKQINTVLGFGDAGADAINDFCLKMLTEAPGLDEQTKVMIANTIYFNKAKGYELKDDFVSKAKQYYDAVPESRDFGDGETLNVINKWANDHTEGMIPEILKEDEFDPQAVSYLLNALYFKGTWTLKFDVNNTQNEMFNGDDEVPMMHLKEKELTYTENDECQALTLPYGNGAYQMTILLPLEGKTVNDVLNGLTAEKWQQNFQEMAPAVVDVKLPRFESMTEVDLKDIMSALGMPKAFIYGDAEFPNLCTCEEIYISLMKQVAKIKVNEEGTEAAAVTIIGTKDYAVPNPPRVQFYANRPFLYVISEQSTGSIFFIGQYMGESSKGEPSGISSSTHHLSPSTKLYNLAGQQLSTPPAKGVYIQNGKRVVIK
ncbi:MAG: serpin family protein [Prevotella sp.]|nr:serpin family protein [Prevotella sp.]